jgi:protein-S-isoprenylcysteine O-methyltransferase Ste14
MPVVPPPVIALGLAGVQRALAPEGRSGPVRRAAGTAVAVAGLGLAAAAAREFGRAQTTVHPLHPEQATRLVTTGPNRLTRNPMYVGMAAVLAGHAVARGGVLTMLPVAAFVAVIDRFQVGPEEEAMRRLFVREYADYCATTRRWL